VAISNQNNLPIELILIEASLITDGGITVI